MIKELRANLMKSQHVRAVSSSSQTPNQMKARIQSANISRMNKKGRFSKENNDSISNGVSFAT